MYGVQYHCAADTAAEGRKCQRVTWGKLLNDAHWNVKFITMDSDKNDQTGTNALNTGLEAIWEIQLCAVWIFFPNDINIFSHIVPTVIT